MPRFLAIYVGTADARAKAAWDDQPAEVQQRQQERGIQAWGEWFERNRAAIVDGGSPLGRTKKVSASGIADTSNSSVAYAIVEAESHEAAARLFENHPHFSVFAGDSIEVMECLPPPA